MVMSDTMKRNIRCLCREYRNRDCSLTRLNQPYMTLLESHLHRALCYNIALSITLSHSESEA